MGIFIKPVRVRENDVCKETRDKDQHFNELLEIVHTGVLTPFEVDYVLWEWEVKESDISFADRFKQLHNIQGLERKEVAHLN